MSAALVEALGKRFGVAVLGAHAAFGDETVVLAPSAILPACRFLHDDPGAAMAMLMDLTAVDYLAWDVPPDSVFGARRHSPGCGLLAPHEPRFEVVYHLYSPSLRRRLRLKVPLPQAGDGNPEVDSVTPVWRGANWYEREAWDLYGIHFRNHPDLRRILLYEEFVGHPLRKDYPKERRQPLARHPMPASAREEP